MPTLYVLHHSPWSERARWALEHHGIAFEEREHVPLLGEIPLRLRRGSLRGQVTVPLFVDDIAVQGSREIAEFADQRGGGTRLFPPGAETAAILEALHREVEELLGAARARFVHDLVRDREACLESLPPALRKVPFAAASARLGAGFVAKKYAASYDGALDRVRKGLSSLRATLAGKPYVLDAFSFADIVGASAVQCFAPLDESYLALPPATRRLWHDADLAAEFHDLVTWRDAVYRAHRRPSGVRAA